MNFINVDLSSGVFILSMGIWFSFCHSDVLTANAVADWDSDLEDPGVDIDRSSHHMPRSCKTADWLLHFECGWNNKNGGLNKIIWHYVIIILTKNGLKVLKPWTHRRSITENPSTPFFSLLHVSSLRWQSHRQRCSLRSHRRSSRCSSFSHCARDPAQLKSLKCLGHRQMGLRFRRVSTFTHPHSVWFSIEITMGSLERPSTLSNTRSTVSFLFIWQVQPALQHPTLSLHLCRIVARGE